MEHTPGPWQVIPSSFNTDGRTVDGFNIVAVRIGITVCNLVRGKNTDRTTTACKPNAKLIASAPDLLIERDRLKKSNAELRAALELAYHEFTKLNGEVSFDTWKGLYDTLATIDAAIAKAKP